jgi:type I restriction enzyme S subunit
MPVTQNMKMTDVGVIPNDWEVQSINDMGHSFAYGVGAEAVPYDGLNKYIRITDIDDELARYTPSPIVSPSFYEDQHILGEGDIVVARTGASVGKSYLYRKEDGRLIYAGFLMKFNVNQGNPAFVKYQLQTERYKKWVETESARTGQPGLNLEQLKRFSFPAPSHKSEQDKIATALEDIDTLICALDKAVKKKNLMKQGAMQKLLTGRVRVKGFTTPWVEVELRQTGVMKSGGTPSTLVPEYWNGNINWLQSGAVQNCYIYPSAVSQKITELGLSKSAAYLISHDSVLIALTGATCANVGYLTFDSAANQSVVSIEPYPEYSAKFLYQLLLTKRDLILQNRGGSAQGGVTLNQLKGITVTLPRDLEEQVEIAAILSAMDNEIAALEAERDKFKNIKQGMMQKLLTGQIRLPV